MRVLSDFIERYKDQRYAIERMSGLDALRHDVESSDNSRATVTAEAGLPESTLSEVLSGPRQLSKFPTTHPANRDKTSHPR
jgi:antitoxin component HigA of HigAB toxin-antitoxin module